MSGRQQVARAGVRLSRAPCALARMSAITTSRVCLTSVHCGGMRCQPAISRLDKWQSYYKLRVGRAPEAHTIAVPSIEGEVRALEEQRGGLSSNLDGCRLDQG